MKKYDCANSDCRGMRRSEDGEYYLVDEADQELAEARRERDEARAEVERLRALCAARPMPTIMDHELIRWIRDIDAAGRGEE